MNLRFSRSSVGTYTSICIVCMLTTTRIKLYSFVQVLLREEKPDVYYEYWTPNSEMHMKSSDIYRASATNSHMIESTRSHGTQIINTDAENIDGDIKKHSIPKTEINYYKHHKNIHSKKRHHHSIANRNILLRQQNGEILHHNPAKFSKKALRINKELNNRIRANSVSALGDRVEATINLKTFPSTTYEKISDIVATSETRHSNNIRRSKPSRRRNWRKSRGNVNLEADGSTDSVSTLKNSEHSSHLSHNRNYRARIGNKTFDKKTFRKRKTRKKRKKKHRQKKTKQTCSKCPPVREVKRHFCTSDFGECLCF